MLNLIKEFVRSKPDPLKMYKGYLNKDFILDENGFDLVEEALVVWNEYKKCLDERNKITKYRKPIEFKILGTRKKLKRELEKIFKKEMIDLSKEDDANRLHIILDSLFKMYKR